MDGHAAVALIVVGGVQRSVDRDLLVVDAETVVVGVRAGKEAVLEDWVRRGFNAGDRVQCYLFDFGKVVLRVLVEVELAEPL
jgi:hypothetical protein